MAIIGFTTHTPFGAALGTTASTANTPLITATGARSVDRYCFDLNYDGDYASGLRTYLRISNRSAGGVAASLNTNTPFIQFWANFVTLGFDSEFFTVSSSATVNVATGRFLCLRMRADGKVRLHDLDTLGADLDNTAFDTGNVALSTNTWYRFHVAPNITTGAYTIKIYNEAGNEVDDISGTGANFGASVASTAWLAHTQGVWFVANDDDAAGSPNDVIDAPMRLRSGHLVVDDTAFPDANTRVGILMPTGVGAHDAWTLGAGASKTAAVNTIPPDGETGYIVSTGASQAQTFTLQTCAEAGITGTPLAFSPFGVFWDVGGAVQAGTRLIENGVTTDSTQSDPGPNVDFHLRGLLHTTMPSDASAITLAKLNALDIGVVRDSGTVEIRVGSVGCHVVYVPATGGVGTTGAFGVSTLHLLRRRK